MDKKKAKNEALLKDWRKARLREITSVKTGPFGAQLHQHDYVKSDGTPIVTVEHLSENGLMHVNLPLVADHDKKRLSQFLVQEGDILFSRVGSVDRSSLVSKKEAGWLFSGRLLRVRPDPKIIDARYLRYFFSMRKFKHHMRSVAVGGTMPSLNTAILSNVKVSYPAIFVQQKIAALLNEWDTAIEKTERLIAAKEKLFKWLLKRLTKPTKDWQKSTMSNSFDLGRGQVISKRYLEENKGIYPVFSSQTSNNGEFGKINTFDFEGSYITWTTDGANAGEVFFRAGKFNCTNVCGTAKPKNEKEIYACFIAYYLKGKTQKYVSYVGNPKLMNGVFGTIPIRYPSFVRQKAIAHVLSTALQEIVLLEKLTETYRTQKRGLAKKLLTGEWRIKR